MQLVARFYCLSDSKSQAFHCLSPPTLSVVFPSTHPLVACSLLFLLFTCLPSDLQGTGRCGRDRTAGRASGWACGRACSEKSTTFCRSIKAFNRYSAVRVQYVSASVVSGSDALSYYVRMCCTSAVSLRPSFGDSFWTASLG